MARLSNTILDKKAFAANANQPMVDIRQGGQFGHGPTVANYVTNAAYVTKPLIAILVEPPRGFQDLEDPQYWVDTLKTLVELAAKSIEGLDQTLTVEHVETPFGGAGEVQQDIANVTRARSTPSFTWPEKYGMAVAAFLNGWVLNLIMDPETKYPRVIKNTNKPTDLLPDYTGMTVMFIEPDPTHSKVIKAWLCTNMRPNDKVADIVGRRDVTASGEPLEHNVQFTALTQVGDGVNDFAQQLLDSMTLTAANPHMQNAFVEAIDAEVSAGTNGMAEQIEAFANAAAG